METNEPVETGFVVSPMSQKIKLEAGQIYEGEITVAVPLAAKSDLSYEATLYPFSVSGDEYQMDFETKSDWSKIVEWTTLENAVGTLKPNGIAKIKYQIIVPSNAPAGGQYAMIGVRSLPNANNKNANLKDQYELASLIYAEVAGETKHDGKIAENKVTGFVTNGTPEAEAKFINEGNVHETAEVKLRVKNVFTGEEISVSEDGKNEFYTTVMPESTRNFVRKIPDLPALGIFEVTQDISFVQDSSSITTLVFLCPVWFLALVGLIIVAIIGAIIFGIRRHHKKSKLGSSQQDFE